MELRPYRSSQKTLIFSTWNFCTTGEKSKYLWLLHFSKHLFNGLVWTWFWWTKLLRGPGSTSTEAKINTPKGIRQPQVDVPTTRVTTTTRQALLLRLSNVDPRCCACAVTSGQRFQVSEPPNLRNSWKQNLWLQKTEIMRANAWKEPIKSEKHLIISYPWIHTQKIEASQIFIYTEPWTKTQLRLITVTRVFFLDVFFINSPKPAMLISPRTFRWVQLPWQWCFHIPKNTMGPAILRT